MWFMCSIVLKGTLKKKKKEEKKKFILYLVAMATVAMYLKREIYNTIVAIVTPKWKEFKKKKRKNKRKSVWRVNIGQNIYKKKKKYSTDHFTFLMP